MHLVTASKDGAIYVWKIIGDSENPDDRLSYVSDFNIDEPLSKVKWFTPTCILVATTEGNVYSLNLERDSQNALCLSRPKLVYQAEHEVAIWDLATYSKGERHEVWLAEDSGKVTQLLLDNTMKVLASKTVHVS